MDLNLFFLFLNQTNAGRRGMMEAMRGGVGLSAEKHKWEGNPTVCSGFARKEEEVCCVFGKVTGFCDLLWLFCFVLTHVAWLHASYWEISGTLQPGGGKSRTRGSWDTVGSAAVQDRSQILTVCFQDRSLSFLNLEQEAHCITSEKCCLEPQQVKGRLW